MHGITRPRVLALARTCLATSGRAQTVDPEARAAIAVADSVLAALSIWMPYDLYLRDNVVTWSHCDVDTFTLMRVVGRWRVAALIYAIEQPPACRNIRRDRRRTR